MTIVVRLFANLADHLPAAGRDGGATLELPDGATLGELITRLAIPDELPRLALVNGEEAGPARRLAPGDVVSLFPPLAGG
ncbi:MAG: MoaD/ThiS family protein [Candidatus Rokuibacteriota bacterium]